MISTIIPTYNRAALLMTRAIPSVLAQAGDWECLVVGDGTDWDTRTAMGRLCRRDRRFRFWNLPHAERPPDPMSAWASGPVASINYGLDRARGEWISILCDDDAYAPTHHETLLGIADDTVDLVYGQCQRIEGDGRHTSLFGNDWRPRWNDLVQGCYLLRASLGHRADPDAWRFAGTWDAEWWNRLLPTPRYRMIYAVVSYYYPDLASMGFHDRMAAQLAGA